MKLKPIRTEQEYDEAIVDVEKLFAANPEQGTAKADRLEVLTLLINRYEETHYPAIPPDPIEAIRFRMDQMDLTRKDLEPYMGSRSRVSEVLNHKRHLSLSMIRKLHRGLQIPAEVLIGATA
ncbi:MAG: transcriptional regulator [Verrucomicrobia bacterium]|jgi:HTH-type transcriptional regulator / antitoxin HigA|nr:transcriptional regulator [Verrucomicrobiota bacterium]